MLEPGQKKVKKKLRSGAAHAELPSYALNNARERLEAYYLQHKEVIDGFVKLQGEVQGITISLGWLQASLKRMCRDLEQIYVSKTPDA